MSSAEPTRIERRGGQRFSEYQVPVRLRTPDGQNGSGFTLDLSSHGALVQTDFPVNEGQTIAITLVMPDAVTLAGNMSVCCQARVLRLDRHRDHGTPTVAVKIEHYEFLPREIKAVEPHASEEIPAARS